VVCDLFLRLAEEPRLYFPRWTEEILAEVRRTQIGKFGWPEDLASYWLQEVTRSFPDALVTDYQPLIVVCRNDPKDRHVLAAAIRAQAFAIITFNRRHFPAEALEPHSVVAHHPADYLCTLYDMDAGVVVTRIHDIATKRGIDAQEVMRRLRGPLPRFADYVAARQGWSL
jgi:hypothetical protein